MPNLDADDVLPDPEPRAVLIHSVPSPFALHGYPSPLPDWGFVSTVAWASYDTLDRVVPDE